MALCNVWSDRVGFVKAWTIGSMVSTAMCACMSWIFVHCKQPCNSNPLLYCWNMLWGHTRGFASAFVGSGHLYFNYLNPQALSEPLSKCSNRPWLRKQKKWKTKCVPTPWSKQNTNPQLLFMGNYETWSPQQNNRLVNRLYVFPQLFCLASHQGNLKVKMESQQHSSK